MPELRCFGPPGTGKTTYLASQVARAAEKYGADRVFVTSFTRAAAAEIGSRGLPIPPHMVATLHAHAYRSLGRPEIAEKHIDEWNEVITEKAHVLSVGGTDLDDAAEASFVGEADEIAARYQTYRAMLRPRSLWEHDVRYFADKWEDWKKQNEYIDFTDMIELALHNIDMAPGEPAIGFLDEAQDTTPLELALVRKWGQQMSYLIMAGDDDQCIYSFKGASPDAFLDPPLPPSHKRVLSQSYRIPSSVHTFAERWVQMLSRRETKEYKPRQHEGSLRRLRSLNYEQPHSLLRDAAFYLENDASIMFLGTCAYMLDDLVQELREQGIPFHNPYRRKNGRWNPLHPSRGVSAAQRLAAWMKPSSDWTPHDIKLWSAHFSKPKVFVRGTGEKVLDQVPAQYRPMPDEFYRRVFTDQFINGFTSGDDIGYFASLLLDSRKSAYAYSLNVLNKSGIQALTAEPKIILGTIHSVKGGEADTVYLFPDLSRKAYPRYAGRGPDFDAVIRQMYVGMTRCRDTLCVTAAAGHYAVRELEV